MTTTDPWVAWLESKVGIVERPPGSNHTPIGVEYGWDGVAWCAETQSLATLHAFGDWILHTAGVADAIARAKNRENGMEFLDAQADVQVGDLACFDFGKPRGNPAHFHISGIVNPGTQAKFETIGGNEGDAVRRQWRDRTYVQCFIRLPFAQVGLAPAPPPQQEDVMVFIAQFADPWSDNKLWFVTFDISQPGSWGTRRHIPDRDYLNQLVAQGVAVRSPGGRIPGGNMFTEVA
jgi:hypothetical protein